MAAKYRKIDPRIWNDERFQQLAPLDKFVALYCLTAQCNRIGLFKFSVALAAEDTGIYPDEFRTRLDTVCHTLFWRYDSGNRTLYFPTWWKYNKPDNEKALMGCLKDLDDIPQSELVQAFTSNSQHLPEKLARTFLDTVSHRVSHTVSPQEQEQEQDKKKKTKQKKKPRAASKARPTVEMVREYCDARDNGIDPEAFVDYYQTQGWKKKNGQPLTDWKGGVRTWERRKKAQENGKQAQQQRLAPLEEYNTKWNPQTGMAE